MKRTRLERLVRRLAATRLPADPLGSTERPDEAFESGWRVQLKRRVLVVVVLMAAWVVSIQGRLIELQVFKHDELVAGAERYQEQRIPLEATRGDIIDRQGRLLAYSVEADSITADPSQVKNPETAARTICRALEDCGAVELKQMTARLEANSRYTVIRRSRSVSPAEVQRVAALKIPGIVLQPDTRRYYPRYELASHILGFVDVNNAGQAGVERRYDRIVRGEDGLAYVQVDAKGQHLDTRVERAPVAGGSLELTIDMNLQYIVERELKAGVEANKARGGAAVVMNPQTGEILALASYPTFNPNTVGKADDDARRNRAIQDVYEPGSTFKMVTASAAIESGVVRPTDLIDTNPGYVMIPGRSRPISDTHPHGVITFEDVIVVSSNVGAAKIGLRTGAERMTQYVHRFGFGQVLAPDFGGQSRGLWNPNNLSDSDLASVSIGYQIGVTPLQMATAASAVANGGLLMEPHVVGAIWRNGRREAIAPKVIRRVIQPETAAMVTGMMEGVVSTRGTAHAASLDRYQVAGKTGTAEKLVDGHYSTTDYNASFVGFVPSRHPAFTILVVIDTPRGPNGYFGGTVSAPVFKRIADEVLRMAAVPPTVDPEPALVVTERAPALPPVPTRLTVTPSLATMGGPTLMPDVSGLSARDATRVLSGLGLSVRASGSGFVADQFPRAGSPIDPGTLGTLVLARRASWTPERGAR